MTSLALLVAGLLAAAAGPSRADNAESCRHEDRPGARPARSGELALRVSLVERDRTVTWRLTVRNRTAEALRLTFPSSQYGDVSIRSRRSGRPVYRWSTGKGFSDSFTTRTLGPRETSTCSLSPDRLDFDSFEPGPYELRAYLTAYDLTVQTRRPFSIGDE